MVTVAVLEDKTFKKGGVKTTVADVLVGYKEVETPGPGEITFPNGGDLPPNKFRWNGTTFVPVQLPKEA